MIATIKRPAERLVALQDLAAAQARAGDPAGGRQTLVAGKGDVRAPDFSVLVRRGQRRKETSQAH